MANLRGERLSRRRFLSTGAAAALAGTVVALAAACGQAPQPTATTAPTPAEGSKPAAAAPTAPAAQATPTTPPAPTPTAAAKPEPKPTSPAAAKPETTSGAPVRFFMVAGKAEEPAWRGIVDAYNAKKPATQIDFELMFGNWDEFHRKLRGYLAAGDAPDMARNQWLMLPTWVKSGELLDLMPYAQRDKFPFDQHWEAPIKGLTRGGKLWGLPPGIYTVGRFYNKTLFDKVGLQAPTDWKQPWSFEQARDAARKLTTGQGPTKQWGTNLFMDVEVSLTWLWCNGGDFINRDATKCVLNEPAAVDALQFQRDLILEDKTAPTPADTQTVNFFEMFNSGRIGFIEGGPWMIPAIEKAGIDWGVMPVFKAKGPVETVEFVEYYSIFAAGKNRDAAWDVIKFFQSEEAERVLAKNRIAGLPTLKSLASESADSIFGRDGKLWLQSMEVARTPNVVAGYAEAREVYTKRFSLVTLDQLPVRRAADEVAAAVNELIAKS